MHVAPVVLVSHLAGPGGWTAALGTLGRCLEDHPDLRVTVRAPGAALEHLVREERKLWEKLERERVQWLAGGFSDPILTHLPHGAASVQLERESVAMETAGVTPSGLWVGDAWEPGLVGLARSHALSLVFLDARLLDPVPDRPGPVERAGEAVVAIPVSTRFPDGWPADGLAAVQVAAEDLDGFVRRHRGALSTPEDYLSAHLPGPHVAPAVTGPNRLPERESFYRELLVLTRDQGDRRPGREAMLRLQSREYSVGDGDGTGELLQARRRLDRTRHRGDSWVEIREMDWDADGLAEVWIGTPEYTLVLDPTAATLEMWNDRSSGWAVTAVSPPLAGLLLRRLDPDGDEPDAPRFTVEGRAEGRSHASVTLSDPEVGWCRAEITGRTLSLDLAFSAGDPLQVGPEIPLNLEEAHLRTDGGDWVEVGEPVASTGHRFRLSDGERTLLVSSPRPCQMFVRPLEGRGLVIWPHWMVREGGTYRLALTPS